MTMSNQWLFLSRLTNGLLQFWSQAATPNTVLHRISQPTSQPQLLQLQPLLTGLCTFFACTSRPISVVPGLAILMYVPGIFCKLVANPKQLHARANKRVANKRV